MTVRTESKLVLAVEGNRVNRSQQEKQAAVDMMPTYRAVHRN